MNKKKPHGAWVKRLISEGHVRGKNYIQVGLRGYYPDEQSFDWMRKKGFRYHTMTEIERRGWEPVMEDIVKEAKDGPEYLFMRKRGLTEKHYLSPKTVDDGRE